MTEAVSNVNASAPARSFAIMLQYINILLTSEIQNMLPLCSNFPTVVDSLFKRGDVGCIESTHHIARFFEAHSGRSPWLVQGPFGFFEHQSYVSKFLCGHTSFPLPYCWSWLWHFAFSSLSRCPNYSVCQLVLNLFVMSHFYCLIMLVLISDFQS